MKKKLGFTLVEIMIVVAIIALLTAIAIPAFLRYREDARRSLCVNNMRNVEHAKESYAISENLRATQEIHWTNIAGYLNLVVDDSGAEVEWDELYCPEVGDDEDSYIYQEHADTDDDGLIGDVSGTNQIWCTMGPGAANTDDRVPDGESQPGDGTFPGHIYLPGRN